MSALKRKQTSVAKKPDTAKKRQKLDTDSNVPDRNDAKEPSVKPITQKSLLVKEQPAFPRGGAGSLTLLEQKQIRAKASKDVKEELFGSGALETDSSDGELDVTSTVNEKTPVKKSKKIKKPAKSKGMQENIVQIESISHKRLADGSLLLGRISNIGRHNLTVALPNNLTGFVSLNAISTQFSTKLDKALHEGSDDENAGENEHDPDIDLHSHFRVHQMLRVAVHDMELETGAKREGKRRINLSIEPKLVNQTLSRQTLASGITVQAAVVSVEDHGVVVDVGLGEGTKGFISQNNLPKGLDLASVQAGSVLLCTVINPAPQGKAIQLSAKPHTTNVSKTAPSIDAYLPGTLVDVLITHVSEDGLAGKVMGLLDVTADTLHSAAFQDKDAFKEKYQVGQKVLGCLIATFPLSDKKKLAFSLLDSTLSQEDSPLTPLDISSIVPSAKVIGIVHGLGAYFELPSQAIGFCHISRLSDKTVDSLSETSGSFRLGSQHEARVTDFNSIDNLYILSLQKSILEQPFLRLEDVQAGQVAKGTIEKVLVDANGVRGLLVKLAAGIIGYVSSLHLSDVALKSPEKKFREGLAVKVRVLSIDLDKRRLDMTLKKALVNSDQPVWSDWGSLETGMSTIGTLLKIDTYGAIVQFYGNVKGRLPVSEMSEAFIKDAREHFKAGQVLTVNILNIDASNKRLTLSARDASSAVQHVTDPADVGTLVGGTVFEKSTDDLLLRLEPSGAIARLPLDHICDGSENKRKAALEKIRVGQKMEGIVILEARGRLTTLSNKASLRKAAVDGKLLKGFESLKEDEVVTGFISNITDNRVFVRFAQGITGVINKASIPESQIDLPDFGMKLLQAVSARVASIDYKGATPRFWLSMKSGEVSTPKPDALQPTTSVGDQAIVESVDDRVGSFADLTVGAVIKVRVTSVKETQLNVEIAKGIQGRVDVSEVFDSFEDIHDRKYPLKQFSSKQLLEVRILGQHDSRTYKFLPLSHRSSKNVVFELSARPSMVSGKKPSVLQLEDMHVGDSCIVFVNNVAENSLMVNVSPAVRGRIQASDVADDLSLAMNLARYFPVGSALKAKVTSINLEKKYLDLSAKGGSSLKAVTIDTVSAGDIVPGRITKITDHSVIVQLSESLVGGVELVDMADDFNLADPARFQKHEIVRAYVLQVDKPNKRIWLSLRPSKVASSTMNMKDPESSLQSLEVNDIRRGFIKSVADKGVFITLAHGLTAFVRVTNLSDDYLKDWKDHFQKDQLVQGKVIAVDKDSGHVQMSLRRSHVDKTYRPLTTFNDLKVGDIVEGKIAKIETFGVFIVVSHSENVRGLCHRSEIAEQRIEDVTKLGFNEGDPVKAKVLKIETEPRRVNFGMKASYLDDQAYESEDDSFSGSLQSDQDEAEHDISDGEGVALEAASTLVDEDSSDGGDTTNDDSDASDDDHDMDDESEGISLDLQNGGVHVERETTRSAGLSVGGFDWFGMPSNSKLTQKRPAEESDIERAAAIHKKKKRKPEILIDRTGDLDRDGPQSVDDFERLLLSEPDNVQLWVQYMAFHMDLGDVDQARQVGEKALQSIGFAQEAEKMVIWVALLNLENTFGDDDSVEATLQRSCQTNDAEEMYSKLASIYIQSGKRDKADVLFQTMTKKFTQNPKLWVNYATFLFDTMEDATRARALLPRALQALPPFTHFDVTSKFAQLEFKTKTGVPEEGRTRFQGLVNIYPKRLDLFNVMIDLEMKMGDAEQVRAVFEQVLTRKMKPAKAMPFFKKWLAFEEKEGNESMVEDVKAKAAKWVALHQREGGEEVTRRK